MGLCGAEGLSSPWVQAVALRKWYKVSNSSSMWVFQLIDRATSPRDDSDPKAEQKTLEESWQDLALIKATAKPAKKQRREDLSEPLLSPARPPVPGEARGARAGSCRGQEDHLDVLQAGCNAASGAPRYF